MLISHHSLKNIFFYIRAIVSLLHTDDKQLVFERDGWQGCIKLLNRDKYWTGWGQNLRTGVRRPGKDTQFIRDTGIKKLRE